MKNKSLEISTWRENDDDCYLWQCEAKRGNNTGHGHGYTQASAIVRAKLALEQIEKQGAEMDSLVNCENTPESKLAEINIREFCLVDYSPCMAELSL